MFVSGARIPYSEFQLIQFHTDPALLRHDSGAGEDVEGGVSATITSRAVTLGSSYLEPNSIQRGRLMKLGFSVDF